MSEIKLRKKRLLHFFLDEKVVNDSIEVFESVFPNENLFVILPRRGKFEIVKEHNNTIFLFFDSPQLNAIIEDCINYEEIIFHSMTYDFSRIIHKMNHPNISWVIWGGDLYEGLLYKRGYKLYLDEKTLFKVRSKKLPVFLYKTLVRLRDYIHYRAQLDATKKINTIVASTSDYRLLLDYYPEFKNKRNKHLFYYPIEKILDIDLQGKFVSGKNIWVNPAAGYNGNHIDILKRLSRFEHLEKVYVPLSYGNANWAKYVEKEGRNLLSDKLFPISTFLPRNEYYKLFLSSNTFIFGHLRQCAVGNIIVALYLGAKVFLFKANPLYDDYKKLGVILFSIDDDLNEKNIYSQLPETIRLQNRKIIADLFSYKKLLSLLQENF